MEALKEKLQEFWNRISPRERRLVLIAAVAVPLTLALWLGLSIRDGLIAMEGRNEKMRKALNVLADLRSRGDSIAKDEDVVSTMGTEPLSLPTYIDNAAKKANFTVKSVNTPQPVTRNGFVTSTATASLDDLTIDQLKTFLMELETGSKVVAVTNIDLDRDFRDKTKLDVKIEVSTYSKEPPAKPAEGSASDDKKGG